MRIYDVATTGGTPLDKWLQKAVVHIRQKLLRKKYRAPDAIEDIERLFVLMQEGVITQEEFDELKSKLKAKIGH